MKKVFTILFFIFSFTTLKAQDKFEYNENGLTEYVVVEFEGSTASELFLKTKNWVKETYKNPDEVLKMEIENEKLRFDGYKKAAFKFSALGMPYYNDARYTVEVAFKDDKIRFKPVMLEQYIEPSQYYSGGWQQFDCTSTDWLYKNNGKLKKGSDTYLEVVPGIFNDLLFSLTNYIEKDDLTSNKDDW